MPAYGETVGIQFQRVGTNNLVGTDKIEPMRMFVDHGDHVNSIPWDHVYLHSGDSYVLSVYEASIADNGTIQIIVNVGSTYNLHMVAAANVGGNAVGRLYETVAYTGGTPETAHNRNRESSATTSGTFISSPATVDLGSAILIEEDLLPGGIGGNALGAQGTTREEMILKRDTTYMYEITNIAGTAKPMSLHLEWYEHLPIEGVD
jgi:hypothetical protein